MRLGASSKTSQELRSNGTRTPAYAEACGCEYRMAMNIRRQPRFQALVHQPYQILRKDLWP